MQITYKLHDSQYQVYNDLSRFIVIAAGRRWGKTVLALTMLIAETLKRKNCRSWYIAPTYRQAEMIAWQSLLQMIPPQLIKKKNEVKLELILIDGSEIALKGADNEDSLRGTALAFVVLDEYATMKQNVWGEIVRPMLADTQGRALFIGTPKGKNHFWELWLKGQRHDSGFSSYSFKTSDNPYIPQTEINEAKGQVNERYYRQEYEANFEDYTGLIWPEYSEKIHVIEPKPLPEHYEKIGAIDPAITGTTASLFGSVDEDGNIFITGEYYEQDKRASEVCERIRSQATLWFMDPAGNHKTINRNNVLFSFFDEYGDSGIYPVPAQNDVNAGINRVAEYFKLGKIKIFKTCRNLIHELERYHWSEEHETVSGVSSPKPYKSMDHACDCLRYLVMSRFEGKHPPKRAVLNSAEYFDQMDEEQKRFQEAVANI